MTIVQFNALVTARADNGGNRISSERTLWNALKDAVFMVGKVEELDVDANFISTKFNLTGLGIGTMEGFAICNGNNGTKNRNGRVAIGYDPVNYATMGATLGSKDAVVIAHSHTTQYGQAGVGTLYPEQTYVSNTIGGESQTTSSVGVSGVGLNIQPSIVTLFIQRIS